ncbi:MAG: DUF3737 family protein [Erysipelotrichaceae bacterium]|nr:DUF3737 family protein [Erysipelotrichaceae bacterium]
MKEIKDKSFQEERALYNSANLKIINCRFEGEEDGESALKESCDITMDNCYMDLRYPLWHTNNINVKNSEMTSNCRAPMWYMDDATIENCKLLGIKAVRECSDVFINDCVIESPEFGWKSCGLTIKNTSLKGEYVFLDSKGLMFNNFTLDGKYSFQYVNNVKISNSNLRTKDAFWHAKDVEVYDTILEGEYLGWYSENLTLVRCHIKGTQPLCYCKNLKMIDCVMEGTDLSFENSSCDVTVIGNVESIKNPKDGLIVVDSYTDLILDSPNFKTTAEVRVRSKKAVKA